MNRIYIFRSDVLYYEAKIWLNFRASLERDEWPADALEERHNAELIITHDESVPHWQRSWIQFKTEHDALVFKLRFS